MTVQFSTTVRNALLDVIETTMGTSVYLRIYSGTPPANPAAALSGNTMLWEKQLASDWASAASAGSKALSSVPLTNTAAAAGTASFYRFYASDGTTCHEQGTVTATGGGGDLTVDNTSIASGQTVNVTAFTKTAPGA